jgi:hypothetical protein
VLAVLLGCVALLVLASTALAAEGTGKITGRVAEYTPGEDLAVPLEGIEVTVWEAGGDELPVEFATTNAKGAYAVEGLASGAYKVEFSPGFESARNYITQYWKDQPSLASADPIEVLEGKPVEEINAELRVGGKIEGTVTELTESEDIIPLKGIEVVAYPASESRSPVGYATTAAGGGYTIVGLATGSYKVRFSPGFESSLNYVTQFYEGASSLASAKPVSVTQEETTTGVNAEMRVGGKIEGTVTDASTHAPLADAEVAAVGVGVGEVEYGYALTNASGQYTIAGLPTGSYRVEFADSRYIAQYYNDQPSFASATQVQVLQGGATAGIDAALVPKAPVNTAVPVASGTAVAGQTLSCSTGSWTGSPTPIYTYAWLRDGVALPGATASTYVIQTADIGNGLTCRVTATNRNGSAAAISNTLIVSVPSELAPVPKPEVKLLSSRLGAFGGSVRVPLACANANCTGTIELSERIAVIRYRGHRTLIGRKTLILGRGSYSLTAGHSATIAVYLTSTGIHLLAGGHRERKASVTIAVTLAGGATVQRSIVLRMRLPRLMSGKPTGHKRHG